MDSSVNWYMISIQLKIWITTDLNWNLWLYGHMVDNPSVEEAEG